MDRHKQTHKFQRKTKSGNCGYIFNTYGFHLHKKWCVKNTIKKILNEDESVSMVEEHSSIGISINKQSDETTESNFPEAIIADKPHSSDEHIVPVAADFEDVPDLSIVHFHNDYSPENLSSIILPDVESNLSFLNSTCVNGDCDGYVEQDDAVVRKRRSRAVKDVVMLLNSKKLNQADIKVVLKNVEEKLGVKNNQEKVVKERRGRKMTPLVTREKVWSFWHNKCTPSTLTTRPAKLKVGKIPKVQKDLKFQETVTVFTNKRNQEYFQNLWSILDVTFKELYYKYVNEYPGFEISYGIFFRLNHFMSVQQR